MTYTVRHIGTVTVQAESEAALEAMLLSYWMPQSVGKVRAPRPPREFVTDEVE